MTVSEASTTMLSGAPGNGLFGYCGRDQVFLEGLKASLVRGVHLICACLLARLGATRA